MSDDEQVADAAATEPADDVPPTAPEDGDRPSRWKAGVHWVFGRRLCFGGLVVALLAFCLSLTPSLLPRGWLFQGIVSGVSIAVGFGVGSAGSALIRRFASEPDARVKRLAWRGLAAATPVFGALFLLLGHLWQDDLRALMDMPDLPPYQPVAIVVVTVIVGALVLVIAG